MNISERFKTAMEFANSVDTFVDIDPTIRKQYIQVIWELERSLNIALYLLQESRQTQVVEDTIKHLQARLSVYDVEVNYLKPANGEK